MARTTLERTNSTSTDIVFGKQETIETLANLAPTLSDAEREKLNPRRIGQIIKLGAHGVMRGIDDVHTLVDTITRHGASTSKVRSLIETYPGFNMDTVASIYESRRETGLNNIAGLAEIRTIVGEDVFESEDFQAVLAERIKIESEQFILRSNHIETIKPSFPYLSGKATRFATARVVGLLEEGADEGLSYSRMLEHDSDFDADDRFGNHYDHDQ